MFKKDPAEKLRKENAEMKAKIAAKNKGRRATPRAAHLATPLARRISACALPFSRAARPAGGHQAASTLPLLWKGRLRSKDNAQ